MIAAVMLAANAVLVLAGLIVGAERFDNWAIVGFNASCGLMAMAFYVAWGIVR